MILDTPITLFYIPPFFCPLHQISNLDFVLSDKIKWNIEARKQSENRVTIGYHLIRTATSVFIIHTRQSYIEMEFKGYFPVESLGCHSVARADGLVLNVIFSRTQSRIKRSRLILGKSAVYQWLGKPVAWLFSTTNHRSGSHIFMHGICSILVQIPLFASLKETLMPQLRSLLNMQALVLLPCNRNV